MPPKKVVVSFSPAPRSLIKPNVPSRLAKMLFMRSTRMGAPAPTKKRPNAPPVTSKKKKKPPPPKKEKKKKKKPRPPP